MHSKLAPKKPPGIFRTFANTAYSTHVTVGIFRRFVNSTAYGTQQSDRFRGSACVFANEEYERNHLIFP